MRGGGGGDENLRLLSSNQGSMSGKNPAKAKVSTVERSLQS